MIVCCLSYPYINIVVLIMTACPGGVLFYDHSGNILRGPIGELVGSIPSSKNPENDPDSTKMIIALTNPKYTRDEIVVLCHEMSQTSRQIEIRGDPREIAGYTWFNCMVEKQKVRIPKETKGNAEQDDKFKQLEIGDQLCISDSKIYIKCIVRAIEILEREVIITFDNQTNQTFDSEPLSTLWDGQVIVSVTVTPRVVLELSPNELASILNEQFQKSEVKGLGMQ